MCFAWWALANEQKIHICVRFRFISFWWFAILLLAATITHICLMIFREDFNSNVTLMIAMTESIIYLVVTVVDFHWCRVLKFYAETLL